MDYRKEFNSEAGRTAISERPEMKQFEDIANSLREYAREHPETMAAICFGIGFVLGWKLKPW